MLNKKQTNFQAQTEETVQLHSMTEKHQTTQQSQMMPELKDNANTESSNQASTQSPTATQQSQLPVHQQHQVNFKKHPQLSFEVDLTRIHDNESRQPFVVALQTSLALAKHLGYKDTTSLADALERDGLTALLEDSLLSTSLQPLMIACASGHTVYQSILNLKFKTSNQQQQHDQHQQQDEAMNTSSSAPEAAESSSKSSATHQVLQLPCIITIDYAQQVGQPVHLTVQAQSIDEFFSKP
jgi:hypothetical protein